MNAPRESTRVCERMSMRVGWLRLARIYPVGEHPIGYTHWVDQSEPLNSVLTPGLELAINISALLTRTVE